MKVEKRPMVQYSSTVVNIIDSISNITPFDAVEGELIKETLSWIRNGAQVFRLVKPDIPNKHLTSFFCII